MLKKTFFALLAVLLLLVLVMIINTSRLGNTQMEAGEIQPVEWDREAMLERFSESITFKTVSHENPADIDSLAFRRFLDFIEESFPQVHERLDRSMVNELTPVYHWQGSEPGLEPILLLGHYDVVPVDSTDIDGWEYAPYSGTVTDVHVWGRGTMDNKNNVMGLLESAEYLLSHGYEPRRSIYFAFGHDEEIGGQQGAKAVADQFEQQGIRLHFVLDEGGVVMQENPLVDLPVALVGVAEKGYVSMELVVRTQGGHSSQPPNDTAISILSEAIIRVNQNQMPARLEGATEMMFDSIADKMPFANRLIYANRWLLGGVLNNALLDNTATAAMIRTTSAPTMLQAGVKDNVLPSEARAVVNFRILPGDTVDDIKAHLNRVIDDERIIIREYQTIYTPPTEISPVDTQVFESLQQTIMDRFGDVYVIPYLVIGATDARHFFGVTDHSYRFSPIFMEEDGLSRIHGSNERILIDSYLGSIDFYTVLIERMTN